MLRPQRLIFQIRARNLAWILSEFKWINDTYREKLNSIQEFVIIESCLLLIFSMFTNGAYLNRGSVERVNSGT